MTDLILLCVRDGQSNMHNDWRLFGVYWRGGSPDNLGCVCDAEYLGILWNVFSEVRRYEEPSAWLEDRAAHEYYHADFYTEFIAGRSMSYATVCGQYYATDLYVRTYAGRDLIFEDGGGDGHFAWYILADCASPLVWYDARCWVPVGMRCVTPFRAGYPASYYTRHGLAAPGRSRF